MKRYLGVALGVLTAIGGFVDVGDLVTNAQVGARFGLGLAWVTLVGVGGICVFAEMSGRIAAVSGRPVFDLVRERLGPRVGLVNLLGSVAITFLTYIAELGGVALAVMLACSIDYLLVVPIIGAGLWVLVWRARFSAIENVLGLLGLALVAFVVALLKLGPDWGAFASQAVHGTKPSDEQWSTYAYYVVALLGSAMTPYEVFFFSSGGVEEKWTEKDIGVMRANVLLGFPLGGVLSLSISACAAVVLSGVSVESLSQVGLPVAAALGKAGIGVMLVGFAAAMFGAACETGLSVGYSISQFFGTQWGKYVRPQEAAAFHWIVGIATALAVGVLLTGVDPVMVTELSVVFSAVALPLTYFPILVVANDPDYLGRHVNGRFANAVGVVYLAAVTVCAVAAVPLIIITRRGQ